jgi:site-specific DNA recombinase
MKKALIYCRVSSERQKNEGHGLDSQEHRCREYAHRKGYEVEKVFGDAFTGAGDFMKRPAMSEMLAYMDSRPDKEYVVIFDDLKRFARDTVFHWALRSALKVRRATPECLNYNFDESPEGRFVETIFSAQNQLDREQNRRQVIQKMKARLEMGYYPFPALPIGYKHSKVNVTSNSQVVLKEPEASIIKEALEGYASGRFMEQLDVQKFLKESDLKNGKRIYLEQVKRILTQSLFYAGYIEYKEWEVSLRKGQHEAIISLATHEKIQEKLTGKVRHHVKKFLHPDFPLRRFVLCSGCKHPLTSSWSTARNGDKRPYFRCNQKGCQYHNKSIHRDVMENGFLEILRKIQPSDGMLDMAKVAIRRVWLNKEKTIDSRKRKITNDLAGIESERNVWMQRLTKASDENVIALYEDRLGELAEKAKVLKSSIMSLETHRPDIETALDIVFDFLKNPLDKWQKGDIHQRRLVLRLVFQELLIYDRKSGFETAHLSLPLRVFCLPEAQNTRLVEMPGIEPGCKMRLV